MDNRKPKLNGAKRQHYLPRTHLKGFASNGGLTVFDRWTGNINRQTIENTAVQTHLYTFEDTDGRRRYEVEEVLGDIESALTHAIPNFEQKTGFSAVDIEYLLSFIAFSEVRTPSAFQEAKM